MNISERPSHKIDNGIENVNRLMSHTINFTHKESDEEENEVNETVLRQSRPESEGRKTFPRFPQTTWENREKIFDRKIYSEHQFANYLSQLLYLAVAFFIQYHSN